MKQRKTFELSNLLATMLHESRGGNKQFVKDCILQIEYETGVSPTNLVEMLKESAESKGTVKQLTYRIIGDMQRRKLSTAFIL